MHFVDPIQGAATSLPPGTPRWSLTQSLFLYVHLAVDLSTFWIPQKEKYVNFSEVSLEEPESEAHCTSHSK